MWVLYKLFVMKRRSAKRFLLLISVSLTRLHFHTKGTRKEIPNTNPNTTLLPGGSEREVFHATIRDTLLNEFELFQIIQNISLSSSHLNSNYQYLLIDKISSNLKISCYNIQHFLKKTSS